MKRIETFFLQHRKRQKGILRQLDKPLARLSIRWQLRFMGYALAKEQQDFINHLVKSGKFNNQSEAVREAIRRMEREENEYLTPPPLTPAQVETIYGKTDKQADAVGRGAFKALRVAARKGARS